MEWNGIRGRSFGLSRRGVPGSGCQRVTSYHYVPPGKEVYPSSKALKAIEATLTSAKASFQRVKTWTTDGIYGETRGKIKKRKKSGCSCVDLEASALFSVAEFRGVEFGQVPLAADDAGGESWDLRGCFGMGGEKEKALRMAVEACELIWFWLADNSKRSSHTLSGQAFCSWSNALVHGN